MPQLFRPGSNSLFRTALVAAGGMAAAAVGLCYLFARSTYYTNQAIVRSQPVPFSHEHHVSGLGIDCRYCHTSVETSAFAGIPPTKTCMTCHSQIWTNAELLQPVRDSWATGAPLRWTRVHDLPDYVFFNHGIHVAKGVGCDVCHGEVQRMPLMFKAQPLTMQWCLECHRHPERYLRPRDEVFNYDYRPPSDQARLGAKLVTDYRVQAGRLDNCAICHR
jgi:hypothetical protein